MGDGLLGLNGKTGEVLRWLLGMVSAALIAYFTAQSAIEQRVTAVETRQSAQYEDLQRQVTDAKSDIKADIRELRSDLRDLMKGAGK